MDLPHTLLSSPGPDSPCPCARWPAGFPASPNSFVAPAIYLLVSLFPFCRWSVQWTSPGLVDFVAVPLFICSRAPDRWANVDFFFRTNCMEKGVWLWFFCYWNSQMFSLFILFLPTYLFLKYAWTHQNNNDLLALNRLTSYLISLIFSSSTEST